MGSDSCVIDPEVLELLGGRWAEELSLFLVASGLGASSGVELETSREVGGVLDLRISIRMDDLVKAGGAFS